MPSSGGHEGVQILSDPVLRDIVLDFKQGMTPQGIVRVFSERRELSSDDLSPRMDPEPYTVDKLIVRIFESFGCAKTGRETHIGLSANHTRKADLSFINKDGKMFIVEAKPLNADLFQKTDSGGVNQVDQIMRLRETEEYAYGIATDGRIWVLIDGQRNQNIFDIDTDYEGLKAILSESRPISRNKAEISKAFYKRYIELLYGKSTSKTPNASYKEMGLVDRITGVPDAERRGEVATVVMNRLIFIKFLASKGIIDEKVWRFLRESGDEIYPRLHQLFFLVMNRRKDDRRNVKKEFAEIPYLNGGLFSPIPSENYVGVNIDSEILNEILEFLDSFSFGHHGNEDADTLDPEILGYIFEMSMNSTNRKGTGAFYTPREVTSYMSEEAITTAFLDRSKEILRRNGYKEGELDAIKGIDDLIKGTSAKSLYDIATEVFPTFRICDNACGSGAFLLAAADVLFRIERRIYSNLNDDPGEVLTKKNILNTNIYGVDLNPDAVEIAKLRLWLWVVDSYGMGCQETLPNMGFNIRQGNSLLGYVAVDDMIKNEPLENYGQGNTTVRRLLEERTRLIAEYKASSGDESVMKARIIDDKSGSINALLTNNFHRLSRGDEICPITDLIGLSPFHWECEFPEVFENGGFDVIVGNPPYVQIQTIDDVSKRFYERSGFRTYNSLSDLYCLFYERSNQILREGGRCAYITSDKWMYAGYGTSLSDYLMDSTDPYGLMDIKSRSVFPTATVMPNILFFKASHSHQATDSVTLMGCTVESPTGIPDLGSFFDANAVPTTVQKGSKWKIRDGMSARIYSKAMSVGTPLKEWDLVINRGITTGLNDAFVLDDATRDAMLAKEPDAKEIIRPLYRGKDIGRYHSDHSGVNLICTHNGIRATKTQRVDADAYPIIKGHLDQFHPDLEKRQDQGDTPYNLRNCKYFDDFAKPKIIWKRIGSVLRISYDETGAVCIDSCCIATGSHLKYLTVVLDSSMGRFLLMDSPQTGTGDLIVSVQALEPICIPEPDDDTDRRFAEVYDRIADAMTKGEDPKDIIEEADRLVFSLYGLDDEESQYVLSHCLP